MVGAPLLIVSEGDCEAVLQVPQLLLHGSELTHPPPPLVSVSAVVFSAVVLPDVSTAVTICVPHLWLSVQEAGIGQLWRPAAQLAIWGVRAIMR